MNLANEVSFVSSDEQHQEITWVRWKDAGGNVVEYTARDTKLAPDEIARAPQRRMDCIDCHNRPTHVYQPPDRSVDDSLAAGKLDASLPYLKREAVALLSKSYATTDEGLQSITDGLEKFYRDNYPELYSAKRDSIRGAVAEVQRIFQTYTFPEMKTDWQTHPNNIGHFYSQGCFRCHDGEHVSNTGLVIRKDCNHLPHDARPDRARSQNAGAGRRVPPPRGARHAGRVPMRRLPQGKSRLSAPVNLGDISQFQCTDCHAGKVWTVSSR